MQFGLDYGLSNAGGRTAEAEVRRVLETAARCGMTVLDTAALYGESESVLGKTLPANRSFRIVTKTPRFGRATITSDDARELEQTFGRSLQKLGRGSVYGLLAHHADDLLAERGNLLYEKMRDLKERFFIEKIGVSIYRSEQIDGILDRYAIDLIQLPVNVLDQRLITSGHLRKLKRAGVEVHARSAFLQGLLLMDPEGLPAYFEPIRDHLRGYQMTLRDLGLSPVEAAIGFVAGLPEVDVVVCGVNDHVQLEEICRGYRELDGAPFRRFGIADEEMLDPSKWQVNQA